MKNTAGKFVAFILTISLVGTIASAKTEHLKDIRQIQIGTQTVTFKNPIYLEGGVTYVPLREFCDYLFLPVQWDSANSKPVVDTTHPGFTHDSYANQTIQNGVIPDEDAAIAIGKVYLENMLGHEVEYQDGDYTYYLDATYYEKINAWKITQNVNYKGASFYWTTFPAPIITINNSNGAIVYLSLYPLAEESAAQHKEKFNTTGG